MTRRRARRERIVVNRRRRVARRYMRATGPRVAARKPRKPRLTYATHLAAMEAIYTAAIDSLAPPTLKGRVRFVFDPRPGVES